MATDVFAEAGQLAARVEQAGRVETAGGGECGLRLAQPVGRDATSASGTLSGLVTASASTATAPSAPFPQTPHEDDV